MKNGFLNNMAPNAQRSFFMALIFAGLAVIIFMFGVMPMQETLEAAEKARQEAEGTRKRIDDRVRNAERRKKELVLITQEINEFKSKMLEHKYGNYIAHAVQILYPIANGAGLKNVKFEPEASIRKLPLPNPKQQQIPSLLHVRAGIRLTANGSFQKAVSMILQLERQQPLATIRELRLTRASNNDLEQLIDMTIEWPAVSAEVEKPAKKAKGARR